MYLGFVLILIGVAVIMGSLTPFLIIPVFAILIDTVFIRVESECLRISSVDLVKLPEAVRRWI